MHLKKIEISAHFLFEPSIPKYEMKIHQASQQAFVF